MDSETRPVDFAEPKKRDLCDWIIAEVLETKPDYGCGPSWDRIEDITGYPRDSIRCRMAIHAANISLESGNPPYLFRTDKTLGMVRLRENERTDFYDGKHKEIGRTLRRIAEAVVDRSKLTEPEIKKQERLELRNNFLRVQYAKSQEKGFKLALKPEPKELSDGAGAA